MYEKVLKGFLFPTWQSKLETLQLNAHTALLFFLKKAAIGKAYILL